MSVSNSTIPFTYARQPSTVLLPNNWTAANSGTATQLSVNQPAAGVGIRHVCNSITVTVATAGVPQTPIYVVLRDGVSGTGTVIWTAVLAAPIDSVGGICITNLGIVGSANTQMTLEFFTSSVLGSSLALTLAGYDINQY